jgi:hypothetical protein
LDTFYIFSKVRNSVSDRAFHTIKECAVLLNIFVCGLEKYFLWHLEFLYFDQIHTKQCYSYHAILLLTKFSLVSCRQIWDQNTAPGEPEANKENIFNTQEQQDVEWQALDVLVTEASSRVGEKGDLEVEEAQSKDPSYSAFVLRNEPSLTVEQEEELVPNILFLTMGDNKQQQQPQLQPQPPPPQPQQQTTAVLDQNVQQVQVQVSLLETCQCPYRK